MCLSVALRKESVDRNLLRGCRDSVFERSLSARRAWIEIPDNADPIRCERVALRKESVDRNHDVIKVGNALCESLSARRAWIEMHPGKYAQLLSPSLSARRAWIEIL